MSMMIWAALFSAAVSTNTSTAVEVARFAVVVGNNHPLPGSELDVLEYADDDALRFAEYFGELGVHTELLTTPDHDTAQRDPSAAMRARRPTVSELQSVLEKTRASLEESEGKFRELFFVFSGHGSITSSEVYLHLLDGRFTRTDLFERILKRMPAERIHVIIDSCHSYFLVNPRGKRTAVAADEEDLDRYPWVGFLMSTSDRREVQEWAGYQAGVFSYQVLGAMRGAADVDGDGVVSYPEAHAYIVAANYGVDLPEARIQPYVRKPATGDLRLADLRALDNARKTNIASSFSGHFRVLDARRGPVLDAHKPLGLDLHLLLPTPGEFRVRFDRDEFAVESRANDYAVLTSADGAKEVVAASKGSIADEFRIKLFLIPLSIDFVHGIEAASPQITRVIARENTADPWHHDPLTLGLLGTGSAGVVTGLVASAFFSAAHVEAGTIPSTMETEAARGRAEDWRGVMIGGFAAGGALLVAGVLRAVFTNEEPNGADDALGY